MLKNSYFIAGASIAIIIAVMSLLSVLWVPHDINHIDPEKRFLPPGTGNIMGADNFGRDIFSRIMKGGGNSLFLAFATVTCAAAAGSLFGLLAGYFGGFTDMVILRIIDTINSFPGILIALMMTAVVDNSQLGLFTALSILFTPSFTRVMRTGAMQYKNSGFAEAEKLLGAGFLRIIFIHILPNLSHVLLSASVLGLSNAILAESAMSYLGLGIQPPQPSWGRMLYEAQAWFFTAPWCALAPGIFIMLTVIAFHFLGEALRSLGNKNGFGL